MVIFDSQPVIVPTDTSGSGKEKEGIFYAVSSKPEGDPGMGARGCLMSSSQQGPSWSGWVPCWGLGR